MRSTATRIAPRLEKAKVVANCDHLRKLKFFKAPPYALTEHGAIQAANVLATEEASASQWLGRRPSNDKGAGADKVKRGRRAATCGIVNLHDVVDVAGAGEQNLLASTSSPRGSAGRAARIRAV